MTTSFRCWAEIDIEAMRSNLRTIRSMVAAGVRIIAIVKADAYGHGLPEVARQLDRDVDVFGFASLSEARAIRSVGARAPVLILGPALPEERQAIVDEGFVFAFRLVMICAASLALAAAAFGHAIPRDVAAR